MEKALKWDEAENRKRRQVGMEDSERYIKDSKCIGKQVKQSQEID
jgi:hypothetical protein